MNSETFVSQETERQMRIITKGAAKLVGEEELRARLKDSLRYSKPLTVKLGLDPSAPDIHLGHAVVLRKLRQLQDLGHHIVIIIGDFTGKIGDPTGRAKGRRALTDKEIMVNSKTYQEQVFRILDREKTQVRYNGEWLELLTLADVVKLAATTTVARMLERDDFQNRFSHNIPIGLHEFFYPLMQAYDSVAINADIELGGTDQTFNILMGRSLQKDLGLQPQAALFMPILEGLDGVEKMSKSLGNYLGIQEDAKVMFKKAMEIPDSLIIRYFELATDILPDELDKVKKALANGANPKDYKLLLAHTITGLYHTEEETSAAEKFFYQAFTQKGIPDDIPTLCLNAGKPCPNMGKNGTCQSPEKGQPQERKSCLLDVIKPLVQNGFIASGSEFRRLLNQGGVSVNGKKTETLDEQIHDGDVLKLGKKKFVRICL